jgi:3-oxoadipate enol-lactonase
MMQAADTASVSVRFSGDGPMIWLFHSLLADAGSCLPLAARLAREWQVAVPDLPGFGASPPVGTDLAAVAGRLAGAIAQHPTPAVIFGNGYGSFLALTVALHRPDLVRALVLAGTGAGFSEPGRAAFRGMAAAAGSKGLGSIVDVAMRRLFSPAYQESHPDLLRERRARFLATDPAVFIGACEALAQMDLRQAVPALTMPVLVLAGAEDEATPPENARELAALLPNAQYRELENCAHVPQMQETDRVFELIHAFLTA